MPASDSVGLIVEMDHFLVKFFSKSITTSVGYVTCDVKLKKEECKQEY